MYLIVLITGYTKYINSTKVLGKALLEGYKYLLKVLYIPTATGGSVAV